MFNSFPSYIQSEAKDCGPSCLKIVSKHYGKNIDIEYLRNISETNRGGTSLTGLIKAAKNIGYKAVAIKESFEVLEHEVPLPAIAHWNQDHFVVVYSITKKHVYVSDPELGKLKYTREKFLEGWLGEGNANGLGILFLLQPENEFYKQQNNIANTSYEFLLNHLRKYKWDFFKISLTVLCISLLEFVFPYLTQQIVDRGVRGSDISFIYMAAIGYIVAFFAYKTSNVIRNWIVIKLSMKLNINLVSDFIKKLTFLPISYFDSKITGDIIQRIGDHDHLENFFTSKSILALFSILNILLFSILFFWYNPMLFLFFLGGTILHLTWVALFFRKRKILDFKYFALKSKEKSNIIELINGMQDIKLNSSEDIKRKEWEDIKMKLYKRDMKAMVVEQFQLDGASIINELKNISLIIISAILVIQGQLTFGTLLAISYIIGHLSSPIDRVVTFFNNIQDVQLGFRRIMEIHNKKDEHENKCLIDKINIDDIHFDNVSFRYTGTSKNILNNISFTIPQNKVTAIVGPSGSGKTTILKLILKFYTPQAGNIFVGKNLMEELDYKKWRSCCGVVMQEGHIFSGTIKNNIVVAQGYDADKLDQACDVSNIKKFIDGLPLQYETKIGSEGIEISRGQKQRILMARSVYRNPHFLLFDEATSALDAENEKEISEKLKKVFEGKTVLLIAHRLSTVKDADQIIVLSEDGQIKETGTHDGLVHARGYYYSLIQNQLELG